MKKRDFEDKITVVTGAASGIGAAICRKFGREGSKIALLDMNEKGVKAREKELIDQGIDAISLKCDVTNEKECKGSIKKIIQHYGGIDILVNNAGITQRSSFVDTEVSVYRRVMDVNFFGSLYCTKAAIETLIERKGLIIVTSSLAGLAPLLGRTGYSASKHALHGLFESLRTEMKDYDVHVMMLCPGFTSTNLQKRALDGNGSVTTHPQSRVGKQSTSESVAERVYKGALKRENLVVLTPVGKITYFINRFTPKLYESIMAKKLKDELVRYKKD